MIAVPNNNRFRIYCTLTLVGFAVRAQELEPELGPDSLFGLTTVSEIHLELEPEEWAKLQPPEDMDWNFFSVFGEIGKDAVAGRHFRSDRSSRPGLAGYFGIDHQYGEATVTIGEESLSRIGVRYKGNGTFLAGRPSGKFPFKIDFNEYRSDREFRGLTKLNLQNNVTDPSKLREALSYELFREVGIPCSRVGWAKVSLTVPGEFDREYLGLYGVVEQVDKRFLKDRYGSAKGLLLKPSTFGTFRYFGDDWAEYEKAYNPKTEASPAQKARLIEFAKLVHKANDAAFEQGVEEYLDMDEFLRFLAVNVLLANLDSFLGGTQNHYVYLDPETNKFQLLPWDMDISFGAFEMVGTPDSRRDLSIDHPQPSENRLMERVLAIPRHKQTYYDYLDQYLETWFEKENMFRMIEENAAFLRPLVALEGEGAVRRFDVVVGETPKKFTPHTLKYFVVKRCESVRSQLDGLSEGQRVSFNEMPPGMLKQLIAVGISVLVMLLLNFAAYVWALIAGFRNNILWGVLNMLLYPVTPVIYGFWVRKDLGGRVAKMTLWSFGMLIAVIVASIWSFA